MKKLLKYILLLVLPITMFAVSSCSDDDDDKKEKVDPIVGNWEQYTTSYSAPYGNCVYITFKDNNHGYTTTPTKSQPFLWETANGKLQMIFSNDTVESLYTIDDRKLIISANNIEKGVISGTYTKTNKY